jgi:hypothetical protein
MGGDIDTRKSMTGTMFYLGSSPVTWQSQKQKVTALSSCEAEYITGTTVACQGVWLALLMTDFVNLKINSAQSFRCAHKDRVCVYVFIWVSARTYMRICIYTVFLKKHAVCL